MEYRYINLTNGLERLGEVPEPFGFIRIQSTWCEQKEWGRILDNLDNDFLFRLAVGYRIFIIDGSPKKKAPRAIYQGIPWIRYATNMLWFGYSENPTVKGHDVGVYFFECFKDLPESTKKRVKYFAKFAKPGGEIYGVPFQALNDGDYQHYSDIVTKHYQTTKV